MNRLHSAWALAPVMLVLVGTRVVLGGAQTPAQTQPTFRTGTAAVSVDVAVRDKSRRPIVDLKVADFVVKDNGVVQTLDDLSYAKRPIDVTVALDVSGSVTGAVLERLRQAIAELAKGLRDVDRVKLVLFNTQVYRAIDFSTDSQAVNKAMRSVPAGGATALIDTVAVELVAARDPERRQLIMFFTDGVDSGSVTARSDLPKLAERARATVTFVTTSALTSSPMLRSITTISGSGTSMVFPLVPSADGWLRTIAHDTGGELITVDAQTNLGSVFRKILEDFRSSYVLFYAPSGVDRPGFHTISVEVTRPGAVVTARRGYFGG